jgi:hypothetical protein
LALSSFWHTACNVKGEYVARGPGTERPKQTRSQQIEETRTMKTTETAGRTAEAQARTAAALTPEKLAAQTAKRQAKKAKAAEKAAKAAEKAAAKAAKTGTEEDKAAAKAAKAELRAAEKAGRDAARADAKAAKAAEKEQAKIEAEAAKEQGRIELSKAAAVATGHSTYDRSRQALAAMRIKTNPTTTKTELAAFLLERPEEWLSALGQELTDELATVAASGTGKTLSERMIDVRKAKIAKLEAEIAELAATLTEPNGEAPEA